MQYLEKEEDFSKVLINKKVLVDFYATWCGPCQLLSPILEKIAKKDQNLTILKVDTDKFPNLSREYGIISIPTLKLFESGKLVKSSVGYLSEQELEDFLK